MNKNEARLYARLKRNTEQHLVLTRIETGSIVQGIPDVNYLTRRSLLPSRQTEGWIELKACEKPARSSTAVLRSQHRLTPAQVDFLSIRWQLGGAAWVLMQCEDLFLFPGNLAPEINSMTYAQLEKAALWQGNNRSTALDWLRLAWQLHVPPCSPAKIAA